MNSVAHGSQLTMEQALRVLRRRWWLIAICVLVTTLAAYGLARSGTKEYTATASLLFTNSNVAQQASGIQAVSQSDPLGQRNTNLQLVQNTSSVAQSVASQVGFGVSAAQVKGAITASLEGQSNVIAVSATWTSPRSAARVANAYAKAFILEQTRQNRAAVQSAIDLVQQQFDGLSQSQQATTQGQSLLDHLESLKILRSMQSTTQLVRPAVPPSGPSSPKPRRDGVIGLVLGLALGVALSFLFARFDRRLREAREVTDSYELPILGSIPHGAKASVGGDVESTRTLEPFRMLRAHLRYFNVDRQLQVILIASATSAEGKTTVATNLAIAAADLGTRTLLIEADLRKPSIAYKLGLEPQAGLTESLASIRAVPDAVMRIPVGISADQDITRSLDVLLAGALPPNPAELLESHAMEELLSWARDEYELVVIDTAPLAVVADTIPLVEKVDGVIVVARLGATTREAAADLRTRLRDLATPTLGIVLNDVPARETYYDRYYGSLGGGTPEPRAAGAPRTPPTAATANARATPTGVGASVEAPSSGRNGQATYDAPVSGSRAETFNGRSDLPAGRIGLADAAAGRPEGSPKREREPTTRVARKLASWLHTLDTPPK